ncbi:MAG TPA: hypothetical protein VHO23_02965 [Candidatus Paceibacterota bacterium]|nr:hypothetical protein [Candidatus Paceibacterota bacterium]
MSDLPKVAAEAAPKLLACVTQVIDDMNGDTDGIPIPQYCADVRIHSGADGKTVSVHVTVDITIPDERSAEEAAQ